MTDIKSELHSLMLHCEETRQTPTEWRVGVGALSAMRVYLDRDYVIQDGPHVFSVMGVPLRTDVRLPDYRVILRSGRNSVGAFTIDKR